jgi:LPXTG-motif cell wall-anchored protein
VAPSLPVTGTSTTALLVIGGALVLGGATILTRLRRRRVED